MSKRKVTLKLTTQKDLIHAESGARTYGELKQELKDVKFDGMRVVVRETKNTLQDEAALLPPGDFVLFLVPEKVKSGGGKVKKGLKKLKNIATAGYNDLRSHGSYLNNVKKAGLDLNGGVDTLRETIQKYYDGANPASAANAPAGNPVAEIEEARAKINAAIDQIIASAGVPVEDTTEYLVKTSVDDLESEIQEIRKALNL
jgi:hypothetical protein